MLDGNWCMSISVVLSLFVLCIDIYVYVFVCGLLMVDVCCYMLVYDVIVEEYLVCLDVYGMSYGVLV